MRNTSPQQGTVLPNPARTSQLGAAADPLSRYLDRRLHVALATLAQPAAGRAARNGARALIEELEAIADVLDRSARAEVTTAAVRSEAGKSPEGATALERARAWYRRQVESLTVQSQRADDAKTQRMLDVAVAELDTLAELMEPPPKPTPAYVNGDSHASLNCANCDELLAFIDAGEDLDALNAARDGHTCKPGVVAGE